MELQWVKIGPLATGPSPVYRARSIVNPEDYYDISGTEGYLYGTFHDPAKLAKPSEYAGVWNLGWAPTLDMMKERCAILDRYLGN